MPGEGACSTNNKSYFASFAKETDIGKFLEVTLPRRTDSKGGESGHKSWDDLDVGNFTV